MDNVAKLRVMELDLIPNFMFSRLDMPVRIQAGPNAIEAFQEWYKANDNPWVKKAGIMLPTIRFEGEPVPYRSNGKNLVLPFVTQATQDGMLSVVNPDWLSAPFELVIGYGVGGMQIVTYKRHG